jgi:hypothetical protein
VLGPLSVFATHGSAAVPLNIGINAHSMALAVVGTFGSIAIALMYMWIISRAVTVPEPAMAPAVAWRSDAPPQAAVPRPAEPVARPAEPIGV